jgi:hypothetical protein
MLLAYGWGTPGKFEIVDANNISASITGVFAEASPNPP